MLINKSMATANLVKAAPVIEAAFYSAICMIILLPPTHARLDAANACCWRYENIMLHTEALLIL
jgi:hypothetical protein